MKWEEFVRMYKLIHDFAQLDDDSKKAILLIIDGLKFNQPQAKGANG